MGALSALPFVRQGAAANPDTIQIDLPPPDLGTPPPVDFGVPPPPLDLRAVAMAHLANAKAVA